MEGLKKRIESIIYADGRGGRSLLHGLLHAASKAYGGGVNLRNAGFRAGFLPVKRLPCRVISIGNISAGGTGKTPMTIYMARQMQQMGYRPAILSRGYKGGAEKTGTVVSDGYSLFADSHTAGDEPFLMACRLRGVPVLVGANRYQSGLRAITEFDPDTIILDDGFQHRHLHRDLDLVLIDAKHGLGNRHLLPRGMLREPVSGLLRADAIVFTRSKNTQQLPDIPVLPDKPIFRAGHVPYLVGIYGGKDGFSSQISAAGPVMDFGDLGGSRLYAFSGIARNSEFREMIAGQIGPLCGFSEFSDHYDYTSDDLSKIVQRARSRAAEYIVTTEKDFVRFAGRMPDSLPLAVVGVQVAFSDIREEDRFLGIVRRKLAVAV